MFGKALNPWFEIEENIESLNCWGEGTPMESVKQPSTTDPSSIAEAVGRIPDGSAFVQRCTLPDFGTFDIDLDLVSGRNSLRWANYRFE